MPPFDQSSYIAKTFYKQHPQPHVKILQSASDRTD